MFIKVILITAIFFGGFLVLDLSTKPIARVEAQSGDKCQTACTDPDRPYYDAQGNKYDAYGNLIALAPTTQAVAPAVTSKEGK